MKIVLITQDDPFYLGPNLDYLLHRLPSSVTIVAAVVGDVSPFGKRESFLAKTWRTFRIFGLRFFVRYGLRYVASKLQRAQRVQATLARHSVDLVHLESNINSSDSLRRIADYQPDLLISIAGNQLFKKPLIELAPRGCLNLHTALLPKYRGLMPTFWVLKNKEDKTGVSVFFVDEGIDSGPILVQKELAIEAGMTQAELILVSKRLGMDAIVEAVEKVERGEFQLMPNDREQMTYFSFPTRADVREFRASGGRFY